PSSTCRPSERSASWREESRRNQASRNREPEGAGERIGSPDLSTAVPFYLSWARILNEQAEIRSSSGRLWHRTADLSDARKQGHARPRFGPTLRCEAYCAQATGKEKPPTISCGLHVQAFAPRSRGFGITKCDTFKAQFGRVPSLRLHRAGSRDALQRAQR